MLIVTFQVQIGFRALVVVHVVVRAAHHMPESAARVEPDLQNVGALGVLLGFFSAQDFFGGHAAPGLDAALLDHVGRLVDDLHGARVQCTRVHMQEEGDGHAPRALARDAPVGTTGDHGAQAVLTVFRVEAGLLDGFQRDLAQSLFGLLGGIGEHAFAFIHADEPLRCSAVDDGRLVAPAMGVAVLQAGGVHQAVGDLQRIQNDGHSLPDVLTTEHGQIGCVHAVALLGVQDVLVVHAIVDTAVEVIHAVGRGRVHDTGTVVSRGVVGQVHGRDAVKTLVHMGQRVLEGHVVKRLALSGGDYGAFQLPAGKAFFDQCGGHDQQAALGVDQAVFQIGVDVQRLVGRDSPGRGRPDDDEGFFVQLGQTESSGQLGRLGGREHHVQ